MGAKSLTHSAGQPERVREKTPRISDHKQCSNHSKIELKWVGVGAAERFVFYLDLISYKSVLSDFSLCLFIFLSPYFFFLQPFLFYLSHLTQYPASALNQELIWCCLGYSMILHCIQRLLKHRCRRALFGYTFKFT